jgi:hypothetical protein
MMKKLFMLLLVSMISIIGFCSTVFSNETNTKITDITIEEPTEVVIISDKGSIYAFPSNERGKSDFSPQAVAGGTINCGVGINRGQICNWSVTALENIIYSNVKIIVEKITGYLTAVGNIIQSEVLIIP